ncbi:MAG: exodeoxyribonuclease VII large subunit [Clostridiales bacterium]|nr:exodeoxyribonuclease VII large subunit [Clostridiales bacterium]
MRERTVTVSQLNEYVKGVFEDELVLHNINVVGEVFECKQSSTAMFITLRENESLLHCVCFDRIALPAQGDKVSVSGNVTFYERTGKISFVFRTLQKVGTGNLLAEFNARKEKLAQEGLFADKKPLPPLIRSIAVITSETGAVIHDFIQTVHRKRRFTNVSLYASSVQGKHAATDIIERLQAADKKGYDLVVIARGGGSGDDLSVFNEESVVRAVAACVTPTVSAVGHETDFTLCDFAASVRAGTPSMAGEIVSRRNEEFFERLYNGAAGLSQNIGRLLSLKTKALYRLAADISYKSGIKSERIAAHVARTADGILRSVSARFTEKSGVVTALAQTLESGIMQIEALRNERLQKLTGKLDNNNPLRILSLGYAKLYDEDKHAVTYAGVRAGDTVRAVLADGTIVATVTGKQPK